MSSVYGIPSTRAVRPSPIFLGLVALSAGAAGLAWIATDPTSWKSRAAVFVFVTAGWVVTLCLHEFAHAYTAWRGGDRGIEARGYLTLNPLKYTHPFLSIVLPILFVILGGIGFPGGAVWVQRDQLRSRAWRSWMSAAGPLTNVAVALIIAIAVGRLGATLAAENSHLVFWSAVSWLAYLQVTAAVINLLPVPGLDGYGIIEPYLSPQWRYSTAQLAPYGMLFIFALLWTRQINHAFFTLITKITSALGIPDVLVSFGYAIFHFWPSFGLTQ